ncbi:hypothetical protein NHF50_01425, partial [Flavobacterium sp. NRK F10]|uniref:hypothetical protein n=1 Tax=Flavobacterium sp. NRK F10 TaxID=2954931 RepID=UPI002090C9A2
DTGDTCKGCSDGTIISIPATEPAEVIETPCEQLKNTANKTVYKVDQSTTTEKQLLTEIKNDVQPTGSCYSSGDENGNVVIRENNTNMVLPFHTDSLSVGLSPFNLTDANNVALNISTFMHTHGTPHYSVPSLDDIHSIYAMLNSGNINDTNNFTFYILSAYGTVYALRIEDKNAFVSWGDAFFGGTAWDTSGAIGNTIKDMRNDQFREAGVIVPKNVPNFNTSTYVQTSEKGLAKFLKTSGNNGIGLYRCYDSNFNNWSKIEINSSGQKIATPCP